MLFSSYYKSIYLPSESPLTQTHLCYYRSFLIKSHYVEYEEMRVLIENIKAFYKKSKVTTILLMIMIIYFVVMTFNGGTTNSATLLRYGAMFPLYVVAYGEYYRFITSIFIHIGLTHMLFNGYALYVFGSQIEWLMGPRKYLLFFLLTGIGGNIVTFFFSPATISAGASGSLFGLLGVFLYLIHRRPHMMTPQGRKSILKLLGINLLITVAVPNISVSAHLGGLAFGYLLSYVFKPGDQPGFG